jgi:hypothetical protein
VVECQESEDEVEEGSEPEELIDVSGKGDIGGPSLVVGGGTTERKERVEVMQKTKGKSTITDYRKIYALFWPGSRGC